MSGVIVGRGDFGQGWLWPGVIVAGGILGRGDFGQGDQDSGEILEGWFWWGDFVRGDCGFIPKYVIFGSSYFGFDTGVTLFKRRKRSGSLGCFFSQATNHCKSNFGHPFYGPPINFFQICTIDNFLDTYSKSISMSPIKLVSTTLFYNGGECKWTN